MKIAFTSCINYELFPEQQEWKDVLAADPDYLFLLGDQIYMDWFPLLGKKHSPKFDVFAKKMKKKYDQQWGEKHFKQLVDKMKSKNGFYGIWDDHDFLWNNAKGGDLTEPEDLEKINYSRDMFRSYFNIQSTNDDPLYYAIDTPFARVIFLDNRTYAQKPQNGEYKTILGSDQFSFLTEKLNHNLPYTLICGGLTLTAGGENWEDYDTDLQTLCTLIKDKKNVLFLSGDIHRNKFVEPRTRANNLKTPPQLISSGMQVTTLGKVNHHWALFEITETELKVDFYKNGFNRKTVRDNHLSDCTTKWLFDNKGKY